MASFIQTQGNYPMKKPLTMRTFTCSFQTLAVLFEGCKTAIMVDVEKAAVSLRRLSGRTDNKEAELSILNHLKENSHRCCPRQQRKSSMVEILCTKGIHQRTAFRTG